MKLTIVPQWYPMYDGRRPMSWAVFKGRTFLCYSWSFEGAVKAVALIRSCQ